MRYEGESGQFLPFFGGISAELLTSSKDGKWVAYVSYPDMTLWRSRLDGREKIQLTSSPLRVYAPRWSPDGSQIAFMDVSSDTPWKIRLVPATGGSAEVIVQGETDVEDPTWTPDGKVIVFSKNRASGGIYRLDLNSKKISRVPNSDGLFSPRLSPDGRYISALTVSMAELKLFDTTTERWSSLAEGVQLSFNEWSHDGRYIYFRGNQGGAARLLRVRIVDSELEEILNLKDFPQRSEVLSLLIGLAPDDAPLLIRDRSVQEIYALELQFP